MNSPQLSQTPTKPSIVPGVFASSWRIPDIGDDIFTPNAHLGGNCLTVAPTIERLATTEVLVPADDCQKTSTQPITNSVDRR